MGRVWPLVLVAACAALVCVADHLHETNATRKLPDIEISALKELYNATGGRYWTRNRGWNLTTDPCNWCVCASRSLHSLAP
jgi:hypothetical protein